MNLGWGVVGVVWCVFCQLLLSKGCFFNLGLCFVNMIIDLPFYENDADGNRCVQVCGKIVLEHFLGKDYSLDELDELMGRKSGMWTYTSQLVGVLFDLGLDVRYYSKGALEPFLEGEPFIRKHFGKDAEKMLRFTDVPVVVESIRKVWK